MTKVGSSNGLLVINLNDSILEHIQKKTSLASSSMYLTDQRGLIVSTKQEDRIGEQLEYKRTDYGRERSVLESWDARNLPEGDRLELLSGA